MTHTLIPMGVNDFQEAIYEHLMYRYLIHHFYFSLYRIPGIAVTTTSISSRERPRPGYSNVGGARECSSATSSPAPTRHAMQQASRSGKYGSPSLSQSDRMPASNNTPSDFLRVSQQQMELTTAKSWDSGLDMFGAVPFSSSNNHYSTQVCCYSLSELK